ncbi:carnitine O-acetyltransferase-like [Epinephelus lanceolatus]
MARPFHLVKPVSATLVSGRNLSQQKELPSQPVPPLQQTCELYLSYMEPILEEDELKQTKKLVEEFQKAGGVGERLQRGLEMKACNTENWVSQTTTPVAIDTFIETMGSAAKLIAAGMELKTMIDNDALPAEYIKGKPLCMKQFQYLFSSCRIPGATVDTMEFYTQKHITVVHNGQFFVMEAYNSDGSPLTVDQLCVQLERICNSSLQTNMEPVGILTTQRRDNWNKTYNNLIKDETNKESVLAIQSSIFSVCLDGAMPSESNEKYRSSSFRQMLHGGGSQRNSGNRWFDKGLQLIIGEDGTCGLNFMCTVADGIVHASVCEHFSAIVKKPEVIRSPMEPLPMPQKLHFNLTPEIKKDIEEAKQQMDALADDLDLSFTGFDHFGKTFIKAHKMRPNAFVQLALKLAYYRMYQQICPSLEYVSLRAFKLGRISLMNTNSPASAAFVKAFDDPIIQNPEKVALLEKALKTHAWYTDMCLRCTDRDQILNESRRHPVQVAGHQIKFASDYSEATSRKHKPCYLVLNRARKAGFQAFLLYPARISLNWAGERYTFEDVAKASAFLDSEAANGAVGVEKTWVK